MNLHEFHMNWGWGSPGDSAMRKVTRGRFFPFLPLTSRQNSQIPSTANHQSSIINHRHQLPSRRCSCPCPGLAMHQTCNNARVRLKCLRWPFNASNDHGLIGATSRSPPPQRQSNVAQICITHLTAARHATLELPFCISCPALIPLPFPPLDSSYPLLHPLSILPCATRLVPQP